MLRPLPPALLLSFLVSAPALAEDDDEFTFEDEEAPAPAPPADEGGEETEDEDEFKILEDEPEKPVTIDTKDDDFKFEGEEGAETGVQGPGEDTASIYQAKIDELEGQSADEEAMAWERYLFEYPNSLYRERIEKRIDELTAKMYDRQVRRTTDTDAGRQELLFAIPMLADSVDPRTKLKAGFEWGFPSWVNLAADLEWALMRELSVHGGLRRRYTGFSFETGAKYALIKSTKTNTIISGMFDFHANLNPAYPGVRPQIGIGQRVGVAEGLDIQLHGGPDLLLTGNGMFPLVYGGMNATLHANETVDVYVETALHMRDFGQAEIGSFRFNTVTFGLRFQMGNSSDVAARDAGSQVMGLGATAPYTSNYWAYHFGAISGDFLYFLQ